MAKKKNPNNNQQPSTRCVCHVTSYLPLCLLKDRAQQDLRSAVGVKVRPAGGGERGQPRADRAGAQTGGTTPHPDRYAPLEAVQRAEESGSRTLD